VILVTGGSGMAGSFIVRELQARGHSVRILARAKSEQAARKLGAEVAVGDLADPESLRRAARNTDGIIHAACTFSLPRIDVSAMEALVNAWQRGPFVFISSIEVYGLAQALPVDERHPLAPDYSGYAWGKIASERLLTAAASARGCYDFSILRPGHVWGPHPRCRNRLVGASSAVGRGLPVVLPGATEEEWSTYGDAWVDARDLAWAAAECLKRPLGNAANTVGGHFIWHELYAELIRLTGSQSAIEHRRLDKVPEGDLPFASWFYAQTWRFSGERLRRRIGFQPARRWQDTVAELVALDAQPV
jgi:nucleoside-diphosphate-sugar epimerase